MWPIDFDRHAKALQQGLVLDQLDKLDKLMRKLKKGGNCSVESSNKLLKVTQMSHDS